MIGGHLGTRASALLDGQLGPEEAERAWAHVHQCHVCRDQVEREGWVKRRLAGLSHHDDVLMPAALKGALLRPQVPWGEAILDVEDERPRRVTVGLAALGGSAIGAAMMGVLALGAAPAAAPTIDPPRSTTTTTPTVARTPTPSVPGTTLTSVRDQR